MEFNPATTFGFTGTRAGSTSPQHRSLQVVLDHLRNQGLSVMLNGCCVGADREAALLWHLLDGKCVFLPGDVQQHAWALQDQRPGDVVNSPAISYLARNDVIGHGGSILVAVPKEPQEIVRSGTWATVRRARRHAGHRIILIRPDGVIKLQ